MGGDERYAAGSPLRTLELLTLRLRTQPLPNRIPRQLRDATNPQLAERVFAVAGDGLGGEEQHAGDVVCCAPFSKELRDLTLARGQLRQADGLDGIRGRHTAGGESDLAVLTFEVEGGEALNSGDDLESAKGKSVRGRAGRA